MWLNRSRVYALLLARCFHAQHSFKCSSMLRSSNWLSSTYMYAVIFARGYARLQKKVQSSEIKRGRKIKSKTVRLIDENGSNLGIMDTVVAVLMAKGKGLELIQVTNDDQPVCKLMSKKNLWEESKHLKEKNRKDPTSIMKEVQIMVGISENDLNNKLKAISAFLDRSHPVKLWIQVKRRHRFKQSQDNKQMLYETVMSRIEEYGIAREITQSPRGLSCILISNKKQN